MAGPTLAWPDIPEPNPDLAVRLRSALDGKAKPPGSLGRLEDLAVALGTIWGSERPRAERARLLLFAGDHGLNQDGVSAYPSAVTAAMVRTILSGRASANALAAATGAAVEVIDVGVDADLTGHPGLIQAKVRRGTANAATGPAMSADEVAAALGVGLAAVERAAAADTDVLLIGEMGIGNTSSAALLMHRLADLPLDVCVGVGAGHDAAGFARKRAVIGRAAARTNASDPAAVLAEFGGLEIVAMAGAVIGAAAARRPVLVDGFIATVAALAATRLAPRSRTACLFAHRSAEAGHGRLLEVLRAEPLLDLGLRLGEGTGALLALPLVRAAARLLSDVATLADILADAG